MAVSGGGSQIGVATASDCAWSATADGEWITLAPPTTGTGNGTVNFSVAANTGSERTGGIVVAGQRATIVQAPSVPVTTQCSFTLAPSSQDIPAAGGPGGPVDIQTQSSCAWSAVSNASWISITSATNGTGNGAVSFAVAANTGAARTGTLTIGGRAFTVNQAAAPSPTCTYTIAPTSQTAPATASSGTVAVTSGATCAWTATSNAAWITITSGAAGVGNGSVGFSVAANSGAARTGTVSIAGQAFTVSQAAGASPCSYAIAPTSQNAPAGASTGTVAVTSGAGCAWTAMSNAPWLTITSGASGAGNGSVAYTVAANTGSARSGTLTIAGQTLTVNQAAPPPACTYSIAPTSQQFGLLGGVGTVNVTTTAGCAWTASSNATWIVITAGASGTGNGIVMFAVAASTSGDRTGTLTIAGQTATVQQRQSGGGSGLALAPLIRP
jgi:hypothetical protein